MSIIDDFKCYQDWNEDGYKFEVVKEIKVYGEVRFATPKWTPNAEGQAEDRTQREMPSGGSDGHFHGVATGRWTGKEKYNGSNWNRENPCSEVVIPQKVGYTQIGVFNPIDLRMAEKRAARSIQQEYQKKAFEELAGVWDVHTEV